MSGDPSADLPDSADPRPDDTARTPVVAGAATAVILGFALPKTARLARMREFRRVYGRGQRIHGAALTIVALRRDRPGHRLGLAVSKQHGRAVRRNKIKRILREAFRLERPLLPGAFDLVLIPKPRDGRFPLDEMRAELAALVGRLARRSDDPTAAGQRRRGRRRRRGGGAK